MSAPVYAAKAEVDLALAARRHLASLASVRAALGHDEGSSNTANSVWLFPNHLSVIVEGTSSTAAVVSQRGGWARPNDHNTMRFRRLCVEIYADPSRDPANPDMVAIPDAEARAWKTWEAFNAVLDRRDAFCEQWGAVSGDKGMRVFGSQLLSEPDVFEIPDHIGGRRLMAFYAINTG